MENTTLIKVTNRDTGRVGYQIPELGVRRQFAARETKEIPYNELVALSYLPGGQKMLSSYLVIRDEDVVSEILGNVEPEYYYSEDDVKRIMLNGSLEEFLDCLDFAPNGVLDMIKDLAVSLPLNDVAKREAILDKLSFNVSKAIEIQNMKYDGDESAEASDSAKHRRVATTTQTSSTVESAPARRTEIPKHKVSYVKK